MSRSPRVLLALALALVLALVAATLMAAGVGLGLVALEWARRPAATAELAASTPVAGGPQSATPAARTPAAPGTPPPTLAAGGRAPHEPATPPVAPANDARPTLANDARPTPTTDARPTLQPAVDWPELPAVDTQPVVATTAHFVVHVADEADPLLTGLATTWSPALEEILAYVSTRLGRELPRTPVHLVFARAYEAPCPARGLASPGGEQPLIMIYAHDDMSAVQVRAVLAHEMVHHLTSGEDFVGDGILTEGIAHWGAGEMLLAWQGFRAWDDAVRQYLARDRYVSITDDTALNPRPGENCLERRDRVYNIRTAFVDWLIRSYGLGTVLAMPYLERTVRDPETGEPEVWRYPDYEAATGYPLAELERRWLATVRAAGGTDA